MNAQNWRPMTTAPKDGTSVLIFDFRAQTVFRCQWRTKQYSAVRWSQYDAWVITNKNEPGGEEMTADYPLAWMPAPEDGMPLPGPLRYFLCSASRDDKGYPELYQARLVAITETLEEEKSGTIWLRIFTWMGVSADDPYYYGDLYPEKGKRIRILRRLSQADAEKINRDLHARFDDEHCRRYAARPEKPDDRFESPDQVLEEAKIIWQRDYSGFDMVLEDHLDSTTVLNWGSTVNVG